MKSVAEQLVEYLKYMMGGWINGGDLERMTFLTEKGTAAKPSNISKRLRELSAAKKIEKDIKNGSVWYRYHEPETAEIGGKRVLIFAANKQKELKLL